MNPMELLESISNIDDDLILEAHSVSRLQSQRRNRKRTLLLSMVNAAALLLVICSIFFGMQLIDSPVQVQQPSDHSHPQRYWDIMQEDYCLLEGTHIRYNGELYVYYGPDGINDCLNDQYLGQLVYSPELEQELSTDSKELANAEVWYLENGLSQGMLKVSVEEWIGQNGRWNVLYIHQDASYSQEFEYEDNGDGTVTLVKYRGTDPILTVPAQLDGKQVTKITKTTEGAFSNNASLVSITIPEGVEQIDDNTFYGCIHLETVSLPASLRYIGSCAFNMCPELTEVTFAGNAPQYGNYLFDAVDDPITICRREGTTGWDEGLWTNYPQRILPPTDDTVSDAEGFDVQAKFIGILSGSDTFITYDLSIEEAQELTIDQFLDQFTTDPNIQRYVKAYTVLDMDGDGISEMVLQLGLGLNDNVGSLVLHARDSQVDGYLLYARSMFDLRADGSFAVSHAQEDCITLKFDNTRPGWSYQASPYGGNQDEKPYPQWFPYPSENYTASFAS